MLGVSDQSVANWIDQQKLRAGKTPGGHRRIQVRDLVDFLKRQRLPIPPELGAPPLTVLFVLGDLVAADGLSRAIRAEHPDLRTPLANDAYTAGERIAVDRPDVVILDLAMPGVDGIEMCRRIKSNGESRRLHVIAITTDKSQEARKAALAAGADACLTAPVDVQVLLVTLNKLLTPRR